MSDLWGRLSLDPREPGNGDMRAGDTDRDVILARLGDAYASGQLTREEYDERVDQTQASRTLGQLVPVVKDLEVDAGSQPATTRPPAGVDVGVIHQRAVAHYTSRRNQAVGALFIGANLICWTIYLWSMLAGGGTEFPWPIFVSLGTLGNLVRVLSSRESIIADREQELLAEARERALPPGEAPAP